MVGRYGLDYAVHIVTSHFGDLVAKVCSCLLHRGSLSLQELIRFTEFSPSTVKNCLLVLIQHNCVQAFSVPRPGSGGTVRAVTLYMSLFDNIIHRSRFSKFVAVVSEDDELIDEGSVDAASTSKRPSSLKPVSGVKKPNFATGTKKPNLGVNLIDGLLQHGRLTFEQLFVREASKQGNAIARDELRVQFNRLVRAQYVERCPRPEPFLSDADDKPASSRRRGAKTFEETPTIEQQALTASALSVAVRFSPLTDIGADTRADVKIKRPNLDLLVGDKVCATIFRRKLSRDASIVVDALMESSKQDKSHDMNTVKASLESILSRARMKAGDSVTREYLTANLEKLECRFSQQESGVICIIENLKEIIEGSQKEEVEAVVLKRYGENACRIFRLLTKEVNGQTQPYETDNISDIAFVDKIEVKGVLYKLWKNEFLDMEDVVSGKEKEQLLRSRWILESSLLKIDDTLLVFRNF